MDTWMIRAGRGGVYAKSWVETGIVGIGWDFDGADIASMSHDQLRHAYASAHPDFSTGKVGQAASQTAKFAHDIVKGATVITYDPEDRLYHIGKVSGECTPTDEIDGVTYKRTVEWKRTAPRDLLATSSRNSLGSLTTIFGISPEVAADLGHAAGSAGKAATPDEAVSDADDDEARFATYDDGIERIKDRALSLGWDEMEQLVAIGCAPWAITRKSRPRGQTVGVTSWPRPIRWALSRRASSPRSSTAKAPWVPRRSALSSAAFVPATEGFTCQRVASPRRRDTRPTVPTCRCACSTSTGS